MSLCSEQMISEDFLNLVYQDVDAHILNLCF